MEETRSVDIPVYGIEEDIQYDIEEMEHAVEVMNVEDLSAEELDVFVATVQKMGKGASEYARKRQAVRDGKVNCGFQPSAIGHNRTAIALDGKLTLNAGQYSCRTSFGKSRTQCYCGQKGHWRGDKSCPKGSGSSSSSKGGKKGYSKKGGRMGGFLQRAGMAAAMLAPPSGHLLSACRDALTFLSVPGLEECDSLANMDAPFALGFEQETLEEFTDPQMSVDAFMTDDVEVAIPHSLSFMAPRPWIGSLESLGARQLRRC